MYVCIACIGGGGGSGVVWFLAMGGCQSNHVPRTVSHD